MIGRRGFLAALGAVTIVGLSGEAEARGRRRRSRTRGVSGGGGSRGTTTGDCPCNGGPVCVGPRGGRYCITASGRKRYGV